MDDLIQLPADVPPGKALVRRDRTSIPDVYRHYDLDKSEREEPEVDVTVVAQ